MTVQTNLGGSFTLPNTSITLNRLGYGAMQLAGKGVFGPPRDVDAAVAVLREAIALGVNHIDTSDFYGPHITNQIIRQALYPYPENLVIVTKIGARRPEDGSWQLAMSRQDLIDAVHDNLRNLGIDAIDVVNLRMMGDIEKPSEGSLAEPLTVLAELKQQGLIRHIGLSNVTPKQLAEAQTITEIVCVQNEYNLAHRDDDAFIDQLAQQGIAYVPFFPLGGFSPLQSSALDATATALNATSLQVALAWLLQRSPNILLIPGTSSVDHLRENLKAASLQLPPQAIADLNSIATTAAP
ncbi:aldo/keto reductase family oxidoreductase [Nostoc flagelliforme FACHB-838]|uniref:Aldo/keto reductase family oxidoreductase n=1 Tax=Nostoc flagelliforme FACHB-838 TaxID=2692904 RepID=A0ABR8DZ73_9NOSO|nr:aldo/keto reductase family oxidoreductase [Nostoc flagelliforme]MBD2534640.1 aldo/keto reductase family oxidoreductase [Nostoc flagelliforme FACHB-838]